jgi:predicted DNA-binding WGR domain protein
MVIYCQTLGGKMAYLEFIGEDEQRGVEESAKFWEVTQNGKDLHIHFGRIGTKGQEQDKSFDSPEAAITEMEKLVKSKIKKGYVEKKKP